jgi:O-antigen ligase
MERPLMMVVHSVLIALVLYLLMVFVLQQNNMVAETRSVFLGGLVLLYMIMFGHSLPGKLNKMLIYK